jgi:5,10-methenyltetrahydromethanopterin hydrogenase
MRTARIVEAEVTGQCHARLGAVRIPVQIHLLVLDAAPQSLDEHVLDPAALAVHADSTMIFLPSSRTLHSFVKSLEQLLAVHVVRIDL